MARKLKKIIIDDVDKREVGYYSTPAFVAQYLTTEMMKLNPTGLTVLDPAVGKGELIDLFFKNGKMIDGYDIIDYPNRSYNVNFLHEDFLRCFINEKECLKWKSYDYIIMNPPFNCHEHSYIASNRGSLHEQFVTGVNNMYSLFLEAVVEIATDDCIIGAVIPDSLLFAVSYNKLRTKILQECEILQIILCPEDLFRSQSANVRTCILVIRKGHRQGNGMVHIVNRISDVGKFKTILKKRMLEKVALNEIYLQKDERTGIFVFDCNSEIRKLFSMCPKLGDMYECGGGVSTGNDSRYTSPIHTSDYSIPFYPNVNSRFTIKPGAFLCDDYQEQSQGKRNFIIRHRDKLNDEGIVCSGIGKRFFAAYLPATGVNGVNAAIWPGKEDLLWLLAYLNSALVTYLLKGITTRGNMTTIGSISSLPVISLNISEKKSLGKISERVMSGKLSEDDAVSKIDGIVYRNLKLPLAIRRRITGFCANISHLV